MKFRHEYKHQINFADMQQLKTRLGVLFPYDANACADGTYDIKSLYFDNYRDKALREKTDDPFKKKLLHTIKNVGYVIKET